MLTYAFIPASLANTAELWVICPKSCCLLLQIAPTQSNLELLLVSRFSLGLSGRRELSVLTRSVVEGFVIGLLCCAVLTALPASAPPLFFVEEPALSSLESSDFKSFLVGFDIDCKISPPLLFIFCIVGLCTIANFALSVAGITFSS